MTWIGPSGRAAWCGASLGIAVALSGTLALASSGGGPTGCVHLCPSAWQNHIFNGATAPCVVTSNVTVIPGSIIDCDTLDVQVTTANTSLRVTDGSFWLKGKSLLVDGQGREIAAACSQYADRHGFKVMVTGGITVANSGRLDASCALGGGAITLESGGTVTIGGNGLKTNGSAPNGRGGKIDVRSKGSVRSWAAPADESLTQEVPQP